MTVNEEVAHILRERVRERLHLILEVARPGVNEIYDREIDALVDDTVKLCDSLAKYLETGTMPEYKSQICETDLTSRILKRTAKRGCGFDLGRMLGNELNGEWDPKPPAEASA